MQTPGRRTPRENVQEYRKTATVLAGQAPSGGIIATLEGDHTYEAGDYICGPGQAGEFWPVKRSIFEATYESVEETAPVTLISGWVPIPSDHLEPVE